MQLRAGPAPALPAAPTTRRRILFLEFYAELGGAELCLLDLLRQLDRDRYAADVATPGGGALARAVAAQGVPVLPIESFSHFVTAAPSPSAVARNALRYATTARHIRRLARARRASVLHAYITPAFKYAGIASLGLDVAAVGTLHDMLVAEIGWTPLKRRVLAANVNHLFRRVVCVSDAARRVAIAAGMRPERLVTIHNGVDAARYRTPPGARARLRAEWGVPETAVLAGVIGRFSPVKGHAVFVEGLRPLLAARSDLHAVLVGDAVFDVDRAVYAEVERAARDPALGGRLHLAGWRSDMPAVLAALDIVAVPSVLPDSLPTVVLQAMAAGRPVVGSAIGGIPEMVAEGVTGRLVPPGDPGALGAALAALADDPAARRRFGAAAQTIVRERFTLARTARAHEHLYDELSAVSRQPSGAEARLPSPER